MGVISTRRTSRKTSKDRFPRESRRQQARRLFAELEPLETRALMSVSILAGSKSAAYFDVDGDIVTVAVSAGTLTLGNFTTVPTGLGDQLRVIDLSGGGFNGVNLTVTVKRSSTGDGLANIGYINSTGHDLGTVSVIGDIGRIDAGDGTTSTPGVKLLSVRSMGRLGLDTQGGTGNLTSNIRGSLTSLVVKGDMTGALLAVTGGTDGKIGAVSIGGSLIGGDAANSGEIRTTADIGTVSIKGDLQGGAGVQSGSLHSDTGKIGKTTIGGSIIGGAGGLSGGLFADTDMGAVTVAHDVVGGAGLFSGTIIASNGSGSAVTIAGSLLGGAGANSGEILGGTNVGLVKVGHNVQGGDGGFSGSIQCSSGKIAGVTIGGSLVGGVGISSGYLFSNTDMGAVKITRDLQGGTGAAAGSINVSGKLTSVSIGGSIIGGIGDNGGQILVTQDIGQVTITGDLRGGSGADTGFISSSIGKIAGVTIGGSLLGGIAHDSGKISSALDMGQVKIAHNLQGGTGTNSGELLSGGGKIAGVTIGGSLVGGTADGSGVILSDDSMGTITIAGNLVGGSVSGAASLDQSGGIISGGRIAAVTVGGSIYAGFNTGTGELTNSGTIRAADDMGSLTVKGSLIGNQNATANTAVVISARGQAVQGATTDLAIGKITIGGRVEFANILAGYGTDLVAKNADAQIGPVAVTGDWIGSNLVAGAMNANSTNSSFGNVNDAKISGGSTTDTLGILSKITSITIKGTVIGTPASANAGDQFGFVSEQVGTLQVNGVNIALSATAHTDNFAVGITGDVKLHEV